MITYHIVSNINEKQHIIFVFYYCYFIYDDNKIRYYYHPLLCTDVTFFVFPIIVLVTFCAFAIFPRARVRFRFEFVFVLQINGQITIHAMACYSYRSAKSGWRTYAITSNCTTIQQRSVRLPKCMENRLPRHISRSKCWTTAILSTGAFPFGCRVTKIITQTSGILCGR